MSVFSLNPNKPGLLDPKGNPFFTLGVNYEGYFDRAWKMWHEQFYDPILIEKDFAKAQQCGFNSVRLFIQKENKTEVRRGNWKRLDTVINLARKYRLAVMLTFNDEHSPHLAQVGEFNAKIVDHFKGDPIIHSWDIENEPRLYNLLIATYPDDTPCPLLTSALVERYGEFITRSQLNMATIPGPLRSDKNKAFYYRNAVLAYSKFAQAAVQSGLSSVDYMNSTKSAYWHPYLKLLSDTVAAWIKPQMEPMKAADPNRLFSIGWNWEILAALPANRVLDFHQIHKYGNVGYGRLKFTFNMLKALQKTFPTQALIMGEFGYSTDESKEAATPRPVDPRIASLHEAALVCFLRSEGMAGGMKWMLNDVRGVPNPFEAGLGVYADFDREKPSRRVYQHLASIWRNSQDWGQLRLEADEKTGIRFHYQCDQGCLSGGGSAEQPIAWRTEQPVHVFGSWNTTGQVRLEADDQLEVQVTPAALSPHWRGENGSAVYRLYKNTFASEQHHQPGQPVTLSLDDSPRLISPV